MRQLGMVLLALFVFGSSAWGWWPRGTWHFDKGGCSGSSGRCACFSQGWRGYGGACGC